MTRFQGKSAARLAVEEALSRATTVNPVTAEQIAERSGFHVTLVRTHIGTAVGNGLAHNMRKGKAGAGLYAAGEAKPKTLPVNVAQPRQAVSTATYTGEKPIVTRPGAMDFLTKPSLHAGEPIERKRPAIICPANVAPVGMHGGRL